jgi:hypothetical protein
LSRFVSFSSRPATDQRPSFGRLARASSSAWVAASNVPNGAVFAVFAVFVVVAGLAAVRDAPDFVLEPRFFVSGIGSSGVRSSGIRASASAVATADETGCSLVTAFGSWPSSIPL